MTAAYEEYDPAEWGEEPENLHCASYADTVHPIAMGFHRLDKPRQVLEHFEEWEWTEDEPETWWQRLKGWLNGSTEEDCI